MTTASHPLSLAVSKQNVWENLMCFCRNIVLSLKVLGDKKKMLFLCQQHVKVNNRVLQFRMNQIGH